MSLKREHKHLIFIILILAVAYFPFVNKAINVDDTMFLKAAEQILVTPLDFFGGEVNWDGFPVPHFAENKNPPFISYLIAAVGSVFGFSEIALHSFFFLPLALSAIGIYLLGRQFDANPLFTAILAIFTPAFLVHGTNVMSDSTMLMFWIWGLVFWISGNRTGDSKWFFLAGVSVAFGILTKYSCVLLLPLIVFSGIWQYKKPGLWMVSFLIPLSALAFFEYYTQVLYGKGLFSEAFLYANESSPRGLVDYFDNTLIGLSFLGGCFPAALLLMPLTGNRLLRVVVAVIAAAVAILIYFRGSIGGHSFIRDGGLDPGLVFQFCAFTLSGICLVFAALKEINKGFSHDSIFLLLWFFGIFIFASYLNWTINARSFILIVPVMGILLSRRLEKWGIRESKTKRHISYSMIGIAGLIAVATVYADFIWAGTARTAAKEITMKYNKIGKVWFQGHWGFQYYMEQLGASPQKFLAIEIQPGDFVVIAVNNTGLALLPDWFVMVEDLDFSQGSLLATMSSNRTAGFYSSVWGPMPYVVETPAKERYLVFRKTYK